MAEGISKAADGVFKDFPLGRLARKYLATPREARAVKHQCESGVGAGVASLFRLPEPEKSPARVPFFRGRVRNFAKNNGFRQVENQTFPLIKAFLQKFPVFPKQIPDVVDGFGIYGGGITFQIQKFNRGACVVEPPDGFHDTGRMNHPGHHERLGDTGIAVAESQFPQNPGKLQIVESFQTYASQPTVRTSLCSRVSKFTVTVVERSAFPLYPTARNFATMASAARSTPDLAGGNLFFPSSDSSTRHHNLVPLMTRNRPIGAEVE